MQITKYIVDNKHLLEICMHYASQKFFKGIFLLWVFIFILFISFSSVPSFFFACLFEIFQPCVCLCYYSVDLCPSVSRLGVIPLCLACVKAVDPDNLCERAYKSGEEIGMLFFCC
jgi:hypothetical protein